MSIAAATTSDRAAQPDLQRARARASATLNAIAALVTFILGLVPVTFFLNLAGQGKLFVCVSRRLIRDRGNRIAGRRFGSAGIHRAGADLRRGATHVAALLYALCRRAAYVIYTNYCLDFRVTAEAAVALRDQIFVPGDHRLGGALTESLAEVDRRKAPASRIETPRFGVPPEYRRPCCLLAEEQLRDVPPPQDWSAESSSPDAGSRLASRETFVPAETVPANRWPVSPAREVAVTAFP